jgi:hypothetical protein
MRIHKRWLVCVLLAAFVLGGWGSAANEKKQTVRRLDGQVPLPPPISVDDVVERILSFDKNKDGKITKDELPERMHHLIALGDTNKDGALDREEVKKLASRGGFARGGFGGPVTASFARGGPIRSGGPGVAGIEGVVDDLKLSAKKKEQALAIVKAHQENVRKLMEQARADMLEKMKQVFSAEEFADFQAALDRPRGVFRFSVGPDGLPRPPEGGRSFERRREDRDK